MDKHCKPKPCKAYRELPGGQFSQGKTCFHNRESCSHYRDPIFITGISLKTLYFPLLSYLQIARKFYSYHRVFLAICKYLRVSPHHTQSSPLRSNIGFLCDSCSPFFIDIAENTYGKPVNLCKHLQCNTWSSRVLR